MTLSLSRMTADDVDIAAAIALAAYGRPYSRHDIRRYLALQPDGWLMARIDDAPAGIGGITAYGHHAVVGLMATHPDFQRRGIATSVLGTLLAYADAWGVRAVALDATEEGAGLYRRHGFVQVDRTVVWGLTGSPVARRAQRSAQTVVAEGAGTTELAAIAALNAEVFGANRARLIARLLEEGPGRACVVRDRAGQASAYAVAQGSRVGPAAAGSAADGAALLDAVLKLHFDEPPRILVPERNHLAAAVLQARGFVRQRSTRYMVRGSATALGNRSHLLGLASFGLG
jgi:GNAT superfamily N-acetyltransferase